MRRPIDPRLHGALDYLTGTSLLAASMVPALRNRSVGRLMRTAGAGHIAYSLATDYPLGAWRKLPYKVHLGTDAAGALGMIASGALRRERLERLLPIGVGLYELGAVLLSRPK